jgi:hypothetical protein
MPTDAKEIELKTARETLEKELASIKRKYNKAYKAELDYLREKKRQRDFDKVRKENATSRPPAPPPTSEAEIVAKLS